MAAGKQEARYQYLYGIGTARKQEGIAVAAAKQDGAGEAATKE
jgi:hypothetical protein